MELTGCVDCDEYLTIFCAKYPNPAGEAVDLVFSQQSAGDLSTLGKSRVGQCDVESRESKVLENARNRGVLLNDRA